MSEQKIFATNEIIFSEGDLGDCAYLIEKGSVLVYLVKDEVEIPLKYLGEGEVFGEMSLIDCSPRSASCRAITESQLIIVKKEQLLNRIQEADPVVRLLMKVLLERLRTQNEQISGKKGQKKQAPDISLLQEKKQALDRIGLESRIAHGVDQNEFVPFYQPIVDIHTGKIVGCEALVRWISKEYGVISPSAFMDVVEESSQILKVGKLIIEKSLIDLPILRSVFSHEKNFFISINVSGRQFADPQFILHLEAARARGRLSSQQIKLELTERIMTAGPQALATLQSCRDLGYRLAIDDFGTGFSSLQYIAQMPLTDLKIDRSFVTKMRADKKYLSVVQSLISLAQSLDLNIIAEGIELQEELELLQQLQVNMGQGFLFSKALPLDEFLQLARRRKKIA